MGNCVVYEMFRNGDSNLGTEHLLLTEYVRPDDIHNTEEDTW